MPRGRGPRCSDGIFDCTVEAPIGLVDVAKYFAEGDPNYIPRATRQACRFVFRLDVIC